MSDLPVTIHKSPYEGAEVGEYTEIFPGSPLSAQRFAKHIISKGGKARIGKRGQDYYVYHTGAGPISKRDWRMSEAVHRFDEPLTGYHIVNKKTGDPALNTPSFDSKDQAQKYLMTKMFANHQDYKVVHSAKVGMAEAKAHDESGGDLKKMKEILKKQSSMNMKEENNMSSSQEAQTWAVMPRNPKHYMKYFPLNREDEARTFAKNSKGTLMLLDKMGKKIPIKESKSASLPSMVSSTENFNLLCDGKNFILRSNGKRLAKFSHADWMHIADAVKNRTTVTVDGFALHQKGDSYTISDTAGNELAYLSATEMDKLIDDAKKYLETTKVVEETSILKIAEMKMGIDKKYTNFDMWKKAVMAHYPQVASKIRWHGRVEGRKSTISAEVPGQDRSYGVWDSDKNVGVILEEKQMKITELFDTNQDPGEYDQEGDMAKTQLKTIISAAQELHDSLSADDNLPEWVQSKLTLAQDYVTTVRDYLKARTE